MKKEDLQSIKRQKFKTYKTGFAIFFSLYLLSFIIGAFLFKKGSLNGLVPILERVLSSYDKGFVSALRILIFSLTPTFLIFLSGITVYAPVASGTSVILSGFFSGALSSFLFLKSRVMLALFEIILSSVQGYASVIYSSVVTLVAIRIFTDIPKNSPSELFTGTLFKADGFRRVFNFRFALSYIAFYIFFTLFSAFVALVRAILASFV